MIKYISKADAINSVREETELVRKYGFSTGINALQKLPAADVLPYSIDTDGTLTITVPKGMKVGRVIVEEEGTKLGGLFYAE